MTISILGWAKSAPANPEINGYDLQRIEIHGIVERIQDQAAYVRTDDGREIGVQLGPQSYWDEQGYYLPEGEYVRMEVWYDPYGYTDWYFAGEIWGTGFHFVLTNHYGVPYWVLAPDDYYYCLGYRASCVSYMVWFDCPPVYFVYVILPPPPPYYACYYGPRWRHHHHEWHRHGPGHDRGDYYGDARDPRPGRPRHRDPVVPKDPPRLDPRTQPRPEPVSSRQVLPATPKPRPEPRQIPLIKAKPRPKQDDQYRAPAQSRQVKYQERPTKPQVREPQPAKEKAPRHYRPSQPSRQSSGMNDARRSSGNRGPEHRNRQR